MTRWLGHGRSSIRGRTPLMEAARQDRTRCCAVLAEAACAQGTGLNAGNEAEGRNSSLHYACYEGAGGEKGFNVVGCRENGSFVSNVDY